MKLLFSEFIEKAIARARYEYDDSVKQWAAWIDGFPGVYAQGKRIEDVRQGLASTLEEYLLLRIREGEHVPGFAIPKRVHVKAA
jgi:predicted RNase H-like HicB family nuclease